MAPVEPVEYLVIGHIAQDVTPYGYVLGGTAAYAALTASRLGLRVGVVTRAAPDAVVLSDLSGVALHCRPASQTTTFENVYEDGRRVQWVRAVADPLTLDDVPPAWRDASVVHLAPIARELSPTLAQAFPQSLVGATPQGWMRSWDGEGRVVYRPLEAPARDLAGVDALVLSEEDVRYNEEHVRVLVEALPLVVVTLAEAGCRVYLQGRATRFPARPATCLVDPTGAGDVFAAAFFVRFWETDDAAEAARFANVVASFSVEGVGTSAIPTRDQVELWRRNNGW
ncbi:MAG: PfkB family carbohydrate kinase [Ardenticatenia bacterium]|nr:PfkB family carbohydrate kinase [Ardenticatenia bacterium]